MKNRHIPIKLNNKRKPKIIQIHDQHGQSAFKFNAGIRLNEPFGARLDVVVVVYITGSGSGGGAGETYNLIGMLI